MPHGLSIHSTALPSVRDSASDADLVVEITRGDSKSLDTMFERYAPSLLALAARITASEADAEDVVQDVFVGLPTALRSYVDAGEFGAWLKRVTVRTALMSVRRGRRRNEVSLENVQGRSTSSSELTRIALETAIDALPAQLRIVFVLKEIAHYSHAEIASTLGIRKGASEQRLFRAIRILRKSLGSHND